VWWPILTDFHVVGYLDQIVHLGAAPDPGLTEGRAINADVGAKLHVVFQNDDPNLRHLMVSAFDGGKTKTVRTDHSSRVDDAAVDLDAAPENAAGADQAAVADSCAGSDRRQGADTRSFAN